MKLLAGIPGLAFEDLEKNYVQRIKIQKPILASNSKFSYFKIICDKSCKVFDLLQLFSA